MRHSSGGRIEFVRSQRAGGRARRSALFTTVKVELARAVVVIVIAIIAIYGVAYCTVVCFIY